MNDAALGTTEDMLNPRLEDKAMGLELQIEELVERQRRSIRQRFVAEAARL
jgi:hypothetical protein